MTEKEIKRIVYPLIAKYGHLNMSELADIFPNYVAFNCDDMRLSETRNGEFMYRQKLRNMISHQNLLIQNYDYGYQIDKCLKPAEITLQYGSPEKQINVQPSELELIDIERYRILGANFEKDIFDATFKDALNFVLDFEKNKLKNEKLASRIVNLVEDYPIIAEKFATHILSIDANGNAISIIVKLTETQFDPIVYTNADEAFIHSQVRPGRSFVYRVFDFNKKTKQGKIEIISLKN